MLFSASSRMAAPCARFLSSSALFAQAVAVGSVSGSVTDQSGSSVPGAALRMIEADKGTVHAGITNAEDVTRLTTCPRDRIALRCRPAASRTIHRPESCCRWRKPHPEHRLAGGLADRDGGSDGGASMVETRDSSIAHVIEQQRIVDCPQWPQSHFFADALRSRHVHHDLERRRSDGQ